MKFRKFTKQQFINTLFKISETYGLSFPQDITNQIPNTKEYVYQINTKNPVVKILIYSSISVKTGEMRNNGNDAVRIIMKWHTKNGNLHKHLAKHLRINTLFVNIRKTLVEANQNVFNLKGFK